jgi:dynein heavy chain
MQGCQNCRLLILCALQVLLRALRDFNLGKLTADDTGIFMGLLNDLFPKTLELVPRAVDKVFEAKVRSLAYRQY